MSLDRMGGTTKRRARWEALKAALDAAEIPWTLVGSYTVKIGGEKPSRYMTARVSEGADSVVRARWFSVHGPIQDPDLLLGAVSLDLDGLVDVVRAYRKDGTIPS